MSCPTENPTDRGALSAHLHFWSLSCLQVDRGLNDDVAIQSRHTIPWLFPTILVFAWCKSPSFFR
ncbi:MAG: hypothetical protein V4710_10310, partial [Verrucomicrobiota bacterium]